MKRYEIQQLFLAEYESKIAGKTFESADEAVSVALAVLNKYLCQVEEGGKTGFVMIPEKLSHPTNGESFDLAISKRADMSEWLTGYNIRYKESSSSNDSKVKTVPIFDLWRNHRDRRKFSGIIFDATVARDAGALNLWLGYGVEPKAGDTSMFEDFVRDVICGEEPDPVAATNELFKLLAWKIQHPTERTELAVVIRGEKGTGKNVFIESFFTLLGWGHCRLTASREDLFGKFNPHLQHTAAIALNEAYWRGHNGEEAQLKQLITETSLPIERKFGAKTSARNPLMIFLMANSEWVVAASLDERRFAVYNVTSVYRQDKVYFGKLKHFMEHQGGNEALLHKLLSLELNGWHPRDMSPTLALQDQQALSQDLVHQWLIDLINDPDGVLSYAGVSDTLNVIPVKIVTEARTRWAKTSSNKFFPVWRPIVTTPRWEHMDMVLGTTSEAYWLFRQWAMDAYPRDIKIPPRNTFTARCKTLLRKHIVGANNRLKAVRPNASGGLLEVIRLPPRPVLQEVFCPVVFTDAE